MTEIILGSDSEAGELVVLEEAERYQGLYVLGATGSGKTTLLENLILQDLEAEHGLCFLDPHRDATRHILQRIPGHRRDQVLLCDPTDPEWAYGLNIFACDDLTNDEAVLETQ